MRIRTQVTSDGIWTVFVDEDLCISGLTGPEAEAFLAAFNRVSASH
ncbi:hypothetical protein [Methylobacterium organophilum]|uniref:DUF1902 domain-containing protein n=1 Tax=Methylobacterium organophilum TaxID=410 RepID=A0ABQ4T8X9_METOR|nr:hypothetical protein [Methylobacterium organophilum]UMY18299.1 hypothetical protein MMB17_02815 [Methylobacterium organophilum]GJE28111.1 hypothetical protein LKMONMHP_2977 [Methylobacterium organophilum]